MEATQSSAEASTNNNANDGAYVLRDLIRDVPLSADGEDKDVYITCVETWGVCVHVQTCPCPCPCPCLWLSRVNIACHTDSPVKRAICT